MPPAAGERSNNNCVYHSENIDLHHRFCIIRRGVSKPRCIHVGGISQADKRKWDRFVNENVKGAQH